MGDRRAKNLLNEGEDSGEPSRAREACGLSWNSSGRPRPSFGEAWVLKLNAGIAHGRLQLRLWLQRLWLQQQLFRCAAGRLALAPARDSLGSDSPRRGG